MKNFLLLTVALVLAATTLNAQTTVFTDDFENGTDQWILEGTWGTTEAQSNSATTSLTDSPGGNYAANLEISAVMDQPMDFSTALDAELNFAMIYDIEGGNFDYLYVEGSIDGGVSWINIATFLGEGNLSPWVDYNYSLAGFAGEESVLIRFRLSTDGGFEVDGAYIDDIVVNIFDEDNGAPLVLHDGPEFYEGVADDYVAIATISDVSGVMAASLTYTVDGLEGGTVQGTNTAGDTYEFVIPAQSAGAQVDYSFAATDVNDNSGVTDIFSYIAGTHTFYDNGIVDFVNSFGPDAASLLQGAAVSFDLDNQNIVYALIRNYTDQNRPNSPMTFHIWDDDGSGLPGADVITPFEVIAEANLIETSPMTRIDLSDFSDQLSGLTGTYFMGYTVDAGQTWLGQTTPAVGGRTFITDGGSWAANPDDDYHFRIITGDEISGTIDPAFDAFVKMFPNPADNEVNLRYDFGQTLDLDVSISNSLGQQVLSRKVDGTFAGSLNLNISNLTPGMYLVRLSDGERVSIKPLVIK